MTSKPAVHVYPAAYRDFFAPIVEALPDHDVVFVDDLDAVLPEIEFLVWASTEPVDWTPATRLRLIQISGAGADGLLPATGLADSVVITNASGSHDPEMPEFVIAMAFALAYRVPDYVEHQRNHRWRQHMPRSLSGRRLCVVGLGTIGQSVARRAAALGLTVTGVRRSGRPVEGVEHVVSMADRLDVITGADVLVVITPLTDETRGLIGSQELAALTPGALLVDVSRGGVTDVAALVDALGSGRLSAAAVDVFDTEPLPEDSPLWDVPNLLVTPHVAGLSRGYVARWAATLADNLAALDRGAPLENVVDRSLGY